MYLAPNSLGNTSQQNQSIPVESVDTSRRKVDTSRRKVDTSRRKVDTSRRRFHTSRIVASSSGQVHRAKVDSKPVTCSRTYASKKSR